MGLFILSNAFTGVVSGEAFGAPECIRISYAASEADLTKSLDRIKAALATLKSEFIDLNFHKKLPADSVLPGVFII
jgi:hypothetical protein